MEVDKEANCSLIYRLVAQRGCGLFGRHVISITDDTQHVMLFILQGHSLSSTTCGSTVGDGEFMLVPVALGTTS